MKDVYAVTEVEIENVIQDFIYFFANRFSTNIEFFITFTFKFDVASNITKIIFYIDIVM